MGSVGSVAELIKAIFDYATEPEGYHADSLERKLAKLTEAAHRALDAKDWPAVDAVLAELKRMQSEIV